MTVLDEKGTTPQPSSAAKPKATATPKSSTQQRAGVAQNKASSDIAAIIAGIPPVIPRARGNSDTTTSTSKLIQINAAAAKNLLTKAMQDAEYRGAMSPADINDFVNKFNAQTAQQMADVQRFVKSRITPAATPQDIANIQNTVINQTFPSYFNAAAFARDYVWSKVNFANEKTLGGKALNALAMARQAVRGFGESTISDVEVRAAAKKIAMGQMSQDDFIATLQHNAETHYPQFADRLKTTPGATMLDIAQPYINVIAKTLEKDPSTITLDDPLVERALRPDGPAGKLPPMSLADVRRAAMNTPAWENTTAANDLGRQAATSLAHAFGLGI